MARLDARIAQLDGVRAIAFLGVFLHHAVGLSLGWMGVDLFFVLSGFLITRILLEFRESYTLTSSARTFYFRRILRIVPPYYVAVTLILAAYPEPGPAWYYGFASNIRDAFHGSDHGPARVMWSIAVEEQFYLLWPAVVLLIPRRAHLPFFLSLVVMAPICRHLVEHVDREAVYRLTTSRMDLLAAGAVLAYIDRRDGTALQRHRRLMMALAAAAAGTFVALTVTTPTFRSQLNDSFFNVVGYSLSVVACACALGYLRSLSSGPLYWVLTAVPLQFVGKVSYVAYLTHLFFISCFSDAGFHRGATAALALVATLSFSSLSWYALEQPLQRLRRFYSPEPRANASSL